MTLPLALDGIDTCVETRPLESAVVFVSEVAEPRTPTDTVSFGVKPAALIDADEPGKRLFDITMFLTENELINEALSGVPLDVVLAPGIVVGVAVGTVVLAVPVVVVSATVVVVVGEVTGVPV